MSISPLVSVLMTAFNREKFIQEAIESVLASTYHNFELIIVDDCSSDNTVQIAHKYEKKDQRIKVFVNEKNLGDYHNRNQAASYAKGKYIKYVDADDLIYSHGLQVLVEMMEKFPDVGLGLCSFLADKDKIYPIKLTPEQAFRKHYFEKSIFNKSPLSAIINRDTFLSLGGFSGKRMVGDFEMWHKLSMHHPIILMPHGLVWYRIHGEQEMKDFNKFDTAYMDVSIAHLQSPHCPLNQKEKTVLLKRLKWKKIKSELRKKINLIK
jgi:glycosyltransferase involved in cell wall biosynthesis